MKQNKKAAFLLRHKFLGWKLHLTPQQTIALSFAALILSGALLLNLPAASVSGKSIGFLDALFTSTSAVCVTGLIVVNTMAHWTLFGKAVILLLIQCGGLGLMTIIMVFMVALRRRISLKDRLIIQASFNQDSAAGMVKLIKKVIFHTLVVEGAGAFFLAVFFWFSSSMSPGEAVWNGIFHSVSAFCNAGFDIIGPDSLTPFRGHAGINFIIMALIILGGLGFSVLAELFRILKNIRSRSLKKHMTHLSLHSKVVLTATSLLLAGGMVMFLLLEWANPETLSSLPVHEKLLVSLFQSTTLRTAGFNTISQAGLTEASQFVSCIIMLMGGSPGGTAGGMKTVTIAVIIISMASALKGKDRMVAFGRTLPMDLLQKALTVITTLFFVVIGATLLLCFTEQGSPFPHTFLDLLFETSSAAATVGISTGITGFLSPLGKIIIIICMFLGRLSPVTVVVALSIRLHAGDTSIRYIDERVIIG